jgi:chemotaxis protein MotB
MARAESRSNIQKIPAWLITFCDLMTLLLTFFVLLISMATLTDESRRLKVLDSVYGAFGVGRHGVWVSPQGRNVLSQKHEARAAPEGPFEDVSDFEPLKPLLWEDKKEDLRFISNSLLQVFSISTRLLFEPGEAVLTEEGRTFLTRIAPVLRRVEYPVMITGHTTLLRDEYGPEYQRMRQEGLDPSWRLSMERNFAVYGHLLQQDVDPAKLRIEAHGSFRPRYTNRTPEGRHANRRVELILDKRNTAWTLRSLSREADPAGTLSPIRYQDFQFDGPFQGGFEPNSSG